MNNSVVIEITQNYGCQTVGTVSDQSFPAHTNTTITTGGISLFTDAEGETLSFVTSGSTPTNSFVSLNSGNTIVTISDPQNADVGNYTIFMTCKDPHPDTGTANMTFNLEITQNVACNIANQLPDISHVAHANLTFAFGSPVLFDDPENNVIGLTGYSIVPNASFITTVNSDFYDYNMVNPMNAEVGNYTWTIFCDDNYVSFWFVLLTNIG